MNQTPFHPLTRRAFLGTSGLALGAIACKALLRRDGDSLAAAAEKQSAAKYAGLPGLPLTRRRRNE